MEQRSLRQVDLLAIVAPSCAREGISIRKNDLSQYLSGKVVPRADRIAVLAHALRVDEAWLMGYGSEQPSAPEASTLPLVGTIACGTPILAEENIEDNVVCPVGLDADFCLRCKGDSMKDARIMDGDIVYIKQQSEVENGQIAAVLIDDEATLKRVFASHDSLMLEAANERYAPMIFSGAELERVRIIGKAVAFFSGI